MVVPKRAAMLLDRLMVALHHALEDGDKEGVQRINELYNRRANKEDDGPSKGNANQYNGNAILIHPPVQWTLIPSIILWQAMKTR